MKGFLSGLADIWRVAKVRGAFVILGIVCLTGGIVRPVLAQQFEKKVTLELQANSWRTAKPFDVAKEFTAKLGKEHIQVVPKEARQKDGIVLIEYQEIKGNKYTMFFSFGEEFGTQISWKLTVLSPASGETLLTLSASGSTPFSVSGQTLYEAALKEFHSDDNYRYAEHFVGAALGMKSSLSKLAPVALWLDSRKEALALLDAKGYRPANAKEEAILAIAREDYDKCISIGKPAVDPLIQFLNRYYFEEHAQKAAAALGKIGDSRAAKPLLEKLRYYGNVDHDLSSPERKAAVITILEALGLVGDNFALADLNEYSKYKNEDVVSAAKAAAAQIRERLSGKKKPVKKASTAPTPVQTASSAPPVASARPATGQPATATVGEPPSSQKEPGDVNWDEALANFWECYDNPQKCKTLDKPVAGARETTTKPGQKAGTPPVTAQTSPAAPPAARAGPLASARLPDDPISGIWQGDMTRDRPDAMGVRTYKDEFGLDIKLQGENVTGAVFCGFGVCSITKGSWVNGRLQIAYKESDDSCTISGRLENNKLVGEMRCSGIDEYRANFTATKKK